LISILIDIVNALEFLEGCNLVHRDLATRNIILKSQIGSPRFKAVVCDVGLARLVGYTVRSTSLYSRSISPPEVFRNHQVGIKNDEWAFGLLLYHLLAKKDPFQDFPFDRRPAQIANLLMQDKPDIWEYLKVDESTNIREYPIELVEIMKGCLEVEESRRWKWEKVLERLNAIKPKYTDPEGDDLNQVQTSPLPKSGKEAYKEEEHIAQQSVNLKGSYEENSNNV